jgi:hypothetical protein
MTHRLAHASAEVRGERLLVIVRDVGHQRRLRGTTVLLVVECLARGDEDGAVRLRGLAGGSESGGDGSAIEEAGPA